MFGIARSSASTAFLALVVLAGSLAPKAQGQATYGSLVGTATDATGASIPNVEVSVTNEDTGVSQTRTTNDLGSYSFTTLFPGTYAIRAEAEGFRPVDIRQIVLQVNQTARFDLPMEVGQVTETVEVLAAAPVLATDTSDVGNVVANREIVDLPLNGRSYLQLAGLTNGVVTFGGAGGDNAGPRFVSQGSRHNGNSYLVGGVDTRTQRNSTYGLSLSVDAIGEFKIMQNAFSAEYGRGTTIVNSTVKSGTNDFHGSLFWFVRNDVFDARHSYNFSSSKTPLRQNQFGTSVGGPIIRDKTFFFGNYEGWRRRRSAISHVTMPTRAQLGGNLADMAQVATDPDTGSPFPGNVVPSHRISQFASAGAEYFATPNGSPILGRNHSALTGASRTSDQSTVRVDHHFNANIRINGFLTLFELEDNNPDPNEYAGRISIMDTKPTMAIQYTHVLKPNLLNTFRFGRYRSVIFRGQEKSADRNVTAEDFGLRNVEPEPIAYGPPGMSINGFAWAGVRPWQPSGATDVNDQFSEQLTYMRGRHTMKFGADLRWLQYDDLAWATQNGDYRFNGQYTGNQMADFLLGIPNWIHFAQRGLGRYGYDTRHGEFSFYFQDDIKLTPELTLNAGVRYELVQFPLEVNDEFANWNFERHAMDFAGVDIPRRILPLDANNYGPRLGLAYNPSWSRKTVFRGGFGIAYGNFRQYESGLQHFHPPYVNENFLGNDVPSPSFTTADLWDPPITETEGVDFSGTTVNYLRDKVMPLFYQWNFNIQHELARNLMLQVGYVGNKGSNLPNRYDANQASQFDPANPRTIQERRPYQRVGFVSANTSRTYSNYNGLDVRLERRFSGGLSLLGTYTWMRQLGIRSHDNYTVMLIDNIRHNYGPEGAPHRSIVSWVYELPFGPGRAFLGGTGSVLGRIIGGWQVNGIASMRSGNFLGTRSSVSNGVGSRAGNKADATGQPANLPPGQRTTARWFNTDAFVDPPFTRYGNAGEGVIAGPGGVNFDISVFKNTQISEGTRLQFRCEMFNAFNSVNLNNPSTNVSTKGSQFGTISGAADARIIQLGLKVIF